MQLSKKGATDKLPRSLLAGMLVFGLGALILTALGYANPSRSDVTLVHWQKPLTEAHRQSGDNRLVLYFISATDSEPSRHMEHALNTKEVAALINERFIPIAVFDVESLERKSAEFKLAQQIAVFACPSIVVMSPDKKELLHFYGYRPTPLVYEALRQVSEVKTK